MTEVYILGVDEVGRGPVAGPVCVGCFGYKKSNEELIKQRLEGMRDSKKLTDKKKDILFEEIKILKKEGLVFSSVVSLSASKIDSVGISKCLQQCVDKSVKNVSDQALAAPGPATERLDLSVRVYLDGGLKTTLSLEQETIIKGDDTHFCISAASVVAKVLRDREMIKMGEKYPEYGFESHKGYGTKKHLEAIKEKGVVEIHRKSFLTRYI